MAAIDTPPGLGLDGAPVGWFVAPPAARRLAWRGLLATMAGTVATFGLSARAAATDAAPRLVVVTTAAAIAVITWAVRMAHVGVADDGVRWGWGNLTVRLGRDRITRVTTYRDAVALKPRRGSTWFLFADDWDRFEPLRRTVAGLGWPVTEVDRAAPWLARVQRYGRAVDLMVVAAVTTAAVTAVLSALA
ncbi:MAG: hypothetical protein R3B06_30240 [Kofleriaceae bacterium]